MKLNNQVLVVAVFLVFIFIYFYLIMMNSVEYSREHLFGIISKEPWLFLVFSLLISLFSSYILIRFHYKPLYYIIPLILIVFHFLVWPISIEKDYITDFYDATSHLKRASYVFIAGHSSVSVDRYFDVQPGVFYATAMFMHVTGVSGEFLAKWFPLFIVILTYIPMALFLGKIVFKNRLVMVLMPLILLLVNWHSRYHYSAQVYSIPLMMLLTGIAIDRFSGKQYLRGIGAPIISIILFASIVIVHQFVSLATITIHIVLVVFSSISKNIEDFKWITILFSILWLSYLMYLTIYLFGSAVETFRNIVETWLIESPIQLIEKTFYRADPLHQLGVYIRTLYTLFVLAASSSTLIYLHVKAREKTSVLLLMIIGSLLASASIISIPLGRAGWIERSVMYTAPLTSIGLAFLVERITKWHKGTITRLVVLTLLMAVLIILGGVSFHHGRNFQAQFYSEVVIDKFLDTYEAENKIPVYFDKKMKIIVLNMFNMRRIATGERLFAYAISVKPRELIEASYWYPLESLELIPQALQSLEDDTMFIKIYSNGLSFTYVSKTN